MVERKADQERREAERKAHQEDLQKMMNAKINTETDAIRARTKARQENAGQNVRKYTSHVRRNQIWPSRNEIHKLCILV
jgi:hypothetical protein